ncbi:hypothetical protein LUZ60_007965 [Juncus effusus]|nr:hypothetical protein LUZ60_007965 [Juncus effusus]
MVAESSGGVASGTRRSAANSAAASNFLSGLPSNGNFTSGVTSNLDSMRTYVCHHDTSPPEGQIIKTDATNILIRALQISKQKNDLKATPKGKRTLIKPVDKNAKRLNTGASSSRQESLSIGYSEQTLQSFTVEKLRALLKERGLSPKGRKDELVARMKARDA